MDEVVDPGTSVAVGEVGDIPTPAGVRIEGLRLRQYAGRSDLEGMTEVLWAAARADGDEWFPSVDELANEIENSPKEDARRDAIVADLDGRLVGFGRASWAVRDGRHVYNTSGEVHPDVRRRGLGRAILRAEQSRLREIAAGHTDATERVLAAEVHDGQTAALALLTSEGYAPIRWFSEMERRLDEPIEPRELPSGLEIRPVAEADHRRIFEAEAEAFRDHWGHREWGESDFRWAFGSPSVRPSLFRVAWAGDEVAGVVATYIYDAENEALGIRRAWLERVSVRRPWRQRGVASALM
ncbi:MAG TPA: GNAT family N-acetyltransferase, partial [Candidatus Dormibacteraeota bacterium]|nr:GNAT family N-acetyltransferase [Candidatus Dormibacteraeota bacterium]